MKRILFTILFVVTVQTGLSQSSETLQTVASSTQKCLAKYADSINEENQNVFVRECLENATEKNMDALLKHYKIERFRDLKLKTYVLDMLPYLAKQTKIDEAKLKLAFAKWLK